MKLARKIIFLVVFLLFPSTCAFAMDFADIDFVDGTLLGDSNVKYIADKKYPDFRFYISSDRQVEFINKKDGSTIKLFENAKNPILVYRISTKKNAGIFFAVFDRSTDHAMKTQHFKLIGAVGDQDKFTELASMDTLKDNGWKSEGLQLRVEQKQFFIDGVTRSKSNPDNIMQPFLLTWDDKTMKFSFADQKAAQQAEDVPKALKDGDCLLAGITLGEHVDKVTAQYGSQFQTSEYEDERAQKVWVRQTYQKMLEVEYDKADGSVWAVRVVKKDFATPRGLTVGMVYADMIAKYGHDFKKRREANGIHYAYSMKKQNPDSTDDSEIAFVVNEKDKIIMIYSDQWSKAFQ